MGLQFSIPGKPIAKKRPRFYRRGKFIGTYNDQRTEEGKFLTHVISELPKDFKAFERGVPLLITCTFVMPIPKSTSKKKRMEMIEGKIHHTKRPDCDNLVKFVKDCCNEIVWHDDSQVVHIQAVKQYGRHPSTEFYVTEL